MAGEVGACRLAPSRDDGGGSSRLRPPDGSADGASGDLVADGAVTQLELSGLPAALEGAVPRLLLPERAGDRTDGRPALGDWVDGDGAVAEDRTATITLGGGEIDARSLGTEVWVVPAPPPRRLMAIVGCAEYPHLPDLVAVPETLRSARALFCGGGGVDAGLGYRYVGLGVGEPRDEGMGGSPKEAELERALGDWFLRLAPGRGDTVAVWFSGHGVLGGDGRLRLQCRDSAEREGVRAGILGRLIAGAGVHRSLVIVDCCHGAPVGVDALEAMGGDLAAAAPAPVASPVRWQGNDGLVHGDGQVYLAAARTDETAAQGGLVAGLEHALRRVGGYSQPAAEPLRGSRRRQREALFQRASLTVAHSTNGYPHVFPNPHHDDVPVDNAELVEHFDPRARGVAGHAVTGWRFKGRDRALRAINAWLADPDGPWACVVTGDPGSGKSAVLARMLTLSAPHEFARARSAGALDGVPEDTLPPLGAFACGLLARQRPTDQLFALLFQRLSGEQAPVDPTVDDRLVTWLDEEAEAPTVVALDALDKAHEPDAVVARLATLAGEGRLRVLVGARRAVAESFGGEALVIDLDAGYRERGDLEGFAIRILLDTHPTLNAEPGARATALASEVAGRRAELPVRTSAVRVRRARADC